MAIKIVLGTENDLDGITSLYDELNEALEATVNYPGWKKGVYPTRNEAEIGVGSQTLYVAKLKSKIVGSIILNHTPEGAYSKAKWAYEANDDNILVVRTIAVHPEYRRLGIAEQLLQFAEDFGKKHYIKALRLDVYEKNIPGIHLYGKCGFEYVETLDLGLSEIGLDFFKLYEKKL